MSRDTTTLGWDRTRPDPLMSLPAFRGLQGLVTRATSPWQQRYYMLEHHAFRQALYIWFLVVIMIPSVVKSHKPCVAASRRTGHKGNLITCGPCVRDEWPICMPINTRGLIALPTTAIPQQLLDSALAKHIKAITVLLNNNAIITKDCCRKQKHKSSTSLA